MVYIAFVVHFSSVLVFGNGGGKPPYPIVPDANPKLAQFSGHVLLDGEHGLDDWTITVWDSQYNVVAIQVTYTDINFGGGYYSSISLPTTYSNPVDCNDPPHYSISVADQNDVVRIWMPDLHLCSGPFYLNFNWFWDPYFYTDSSCPCTVVY